MNAITEIEAVSDSDIDKPISWMVSAIMAQERLTQHKPEAEESIFSSREAAIAHKDTLKSQGYIATVTPVFLSPQQRGKARAKGQTRTAPRKFNEDWRLHNAGGATGETT